MSPLLMSAFEVLDHGLFHYLRSDTSLDIKFALLHIDQAIELLLKDKVRMGGHSIYKSGGKETISRYAAFDILENHLKVTTPEKADLELLHEERNNIQHKYSTPTPHTANFYVEVAMTFIRRFCTNELKVDIAEYVSSKNLKLIDELFAPVAAPPSGSTTPVAMSATLVLAPPAKNVS